MFVSVYVCLSYVSVSVFVNVSNVQYIFIESI